MLPNKTSSGGFFQSLGTHGSIPKFEKTRSQIPKQDVYYLNGKPMYNGPVSQHSRAPEIRRSIPKTKTTGINDFHSQQGTNHSQLATQFALARQQLPTTRATFPKKNENRSAPLPPSQNQIKSNYHQYSANSLNALRQTRAAPPPPPRKFMTTNPALYQPMLRTGSPLARHNHPIPIMNNFAQNAPSSLSPNFSSHNFPSLPTRQNNTPPNYSVPSSQSITSQTTPTQSDSTENSLPLSSFSESSKDFTPIKDQMNETPREIDPDEVLLIEECKKVAQEFSRRPETIAFLAPVDFRGLQLYDYPQVIKQPMDLGTLVKNVDTGKYRNVKQFNVDMNLIWDNAKKYNAPGSGIFLVAEKLQDMWQRKYRRLKKKSGKGKKRKKRGYGYEDENDDVAEGLRTRLTDCLRNLNAEDVASLVEIIQKNCKPAYHEEGEDEHIEIEVCELDLRTLENVVGYAEDCVSGVKRRRRKL